MPGKMWRQKMIQKKVLLIEDEPHQIMMVRYRLEANNFDFASAADGKEGLKKTKSEKPDVILLDIVMPEMDGYEVCKRIRKDPATKDIPVILFTASVIKNLKEKCLDCGADDYVVKPFESETLVGKIKQVLKI
jgi:two-component system alkaline phosphatase synthesis response regulator PhoP